MTAIMPTAHPRTGRRAANQGGFTLLEVLVALAIVGVALAAIARTTSMLTTNNGLLREHAMALLSAKNQLVEMAIASTPAKNGTARLPCPQGSLALTCETRVVVLSDGARAVTVEVYADRRPTPRLATLSGVIDAMN